MLEIEVQAQSAAAATTVWAILTDATTWTAWSPVDRAQVESGHELGEVRRFRVPLVAGLSWPRLMRCRGGASAPRDPRLMLEVLHVNDSRRPR